LNFSGVYIDLVCPAIQFFSYFWSKPHLTHDNLDDTRLSIRENWKQGAIENLAVQSVTSEIFEPVGYNGSVPPENIRFITPASDKLVILTDQSEAGQGLWLYGSEN